DSREFFSMEDLCKLFSLEKINKSPAVFDYRKLDWFNGQYIRMKDSEELKSMLLPFLIKDGIITDPPSPAQMDIFNGAFPIIRERLKLLNDVSPMLRFLFTDPGVGNVEDAIPKKMDASGAAIALGIGMKLLADAKDPASEAWDEEMDNLFREKAKEKEMKIGAMLQPLRLAVTSSKVSPPLFPAIRLLGLEESLKRIRRLIQALESE
ncbi:MAG: glutamate--tRNA ligase, partial [Spirochaetaceae bacterium]|nr:glutamate--tRNA ligase [Spirochaetaceae bacterium]